MNKKISYLIYLFIRLLNYLYFTITKKNFIFFLYDFIQEKSFIELKILNKIKIFFTPNELTRWRVKTFFDKEPETIEWINNFKDTRGTIFWDIGANIGLYSIYNAIKNPKITTISFEPSASNLKILSKNISLNNLKQINIFPIALSNKPSGFFLMNESENIEGAALNSFGEKFNFEGKKFKPTTSYNFYGTNIKNLLDKKILKIPNYIKIDVDGIEHLILQGMGKYIKNKKIKSILVEINQDFKIQYKSIINLMKKNNFYLLHKKRNENFFKNSSSMKNVFNYVFFKKGI